jgi:hypothetical protein
MLEGRHVNIFGDLSRPFDGCGGGVSLFGSEDQFGGEFGPAYGGNLLLQSWTEHNGLRCDWGEVTGSFLICF